MTNSGFLTTTLEKTLGWARSRSLWYFKVGTGCCADEILETYGCRYDLERFGTLPSVSHQHADLLIVSGMISKKAAPELVKLYNEMPSPKYVLVVGACACKGGAFSLPYHYSTVPGVHELIPVDVFVPGCPPRPEAIMNGLITLQEKINGLGSTASHH